MGGGGDFTTIQLSGFSVLRRPKPFQSAPQAQGLSRLWGQTFFPKINVCKINKNALSLRDIQPKNEPNSRIFHGICPKNAQILHDNCPKNLSPFFFGGGGGHEHPLPTMHGYVQHKIPPIFFLTCTQRITVPRAVGTRPTARALASLMMTSRPWPPSK